MIHTGWIKPPCAQCPYTLRLVHTVISPCPQCKVNDYKAYEQFKKELSKKGSGCEMAAINVIV